MCKGEMRLERIQTYNGTFLVALCLCFKMRSEMLLCEPEKREHFNLNLIVLCQKLVYFFPVFILLLFSKSFSAKTKCKFK